MSPTQRARDTRVGNDRPSDVAAVFFYFFLFVGASPFRSYVGMLLYMYVPQATSSSLCPMSKGPTFTCPLVIYYTHCRAGSTKPLLSLFGIS
jgi:hypothetical protein